jgi:hypothetical protein
MDQVAATLPAESVHEVHRELDLTGAMPPGMHRMRIEVLAPEEDSNLYLTPLENALGPGLELGDDLGEAIEAALGPDGLEEPSPFEGLADFRRLRRRIRTGGLRILAAVDRTRNNTSIVMRWTYDETVRVLLTGDAEETSWQIMQKNGADLSSEAIKVGHHGSINASPEWSFDDVFPSVRATNAALVSTDPTRFTGENEVPKAEVLAGWLGRLQDPARLLRTDSVPQGQSVEVRFQT